jgi:hypothetical protein
MQAATERFLDIASLSAEERSPGGGRFLRKMQKAELRTVLRTIFFRLGLIRATCLLMLPLIASGLLDKAFDKAAYLSHNALVGIEPLRAVAGAGVGTKVNTCHAG